MIGMIGEDGNPLPPKPVRFLNRQKTLDFVAKKDTLPPMCGDKVDMNGRIYTVTAVVHYETEVRVWVEHCVVQVGSV